MRRFFGFGFLISVLLALLIAGVGFAQGTSPGDPTDDEVNAIAKQLYCPVCENIPLDVCPTQACAEWREEIQDKLALGWNEAQIKQHFADRYGDRVLAVPPPRGLNWLVYIIPPAAIFLGALILYRAFRTWKLPSLPAAANSAAEKSPDHGAESPQDKYIARLEEELRKQ